MLIILKLSATSGFAQDANKIKWFENADGFNKKRLTNISVLGSVGYTGTLIILNKYWYSNYARSSFHFFNDNNEWNQVDKAGHVITSYYFGKAGIDLMNWAGVKNKKSTIYGGLLGSVLLTNIEILDGFSSKWGASLGDITANSIGSIVVIAQDWFWDEQKVHLKYSFKKPTYSSDIQNRTDQLFGNHLSEQLLKDYNGQTYWVSANIKSFILKSSKIPNWLNLSLGYGAEGMLGSTTNYYSIGDEAFDHTDIERFRQYYFSFDIDLTRIETKSKILKIFTNVFGFIKIPAPTFEFNKIDKFKFHYFYF